MQLKIYNYEMLNFESQKLIISEKGISQINSEPLWCVLRELQEAKERLITESDLDNLIAHNTLPKAETKAFLNKTIKIQKHVGNPYFENILIIHSFSNTQQLKKLFKKEILRNHHLIHTDKLDIEQLKDKKLFIHFFCEKYNYSVLHEHYFKIAELSPASALCVSYFTGDFFSVSQPFIPETGSPCHFCAIDRVNSYENHAPSNNSWSKLLLFCKNHNIAIPAKAPTLLQKNMAYGLLAQRINLYTTQNTSHRHQDCVFSLASINLRTGELTEEIVPHWPLCTCLRSK